MLQQAYTNSLEVAAKTGEMKEFLALIMIVDKVECKKKTKCNMADAISHCKSTYGIGDFSTYGDTLNEKIREITGDKKKGNGDQSHAASDASVGTPPKGAQGAAGPRGLKRKQVKKEPDVSVISLASSSQQGDAEAEQVTEAVAEIQEEVLEEVPQEEDQDQNTLVKVVKVNPDAAKARRGRLTNFETDKENVLWI